MQTQGCSISTLPASSEYTAIDMTEASATFSLVIFSYTGHPMLPALIGKMAEPESIGKVVAGATALVTAFYCVFGIVGYHFYADTAESLVIENFSGYPMIAACLTMVLKVPGSSGREGGP